MKSTNPRMAMMLGRAKKRPALAVNPMKSVAPTMPASMPTMKKGGCATKSDAKMIAKKEVKGHEKSMHGMKKGGITEKGTGEKYASKAAMMRHEKKETKAEEMKEHGMKRGGKCYAAGGKTSQLSKANGIAIKGKTKGKII